MKDGEAYGRVLVVRKDKSGVTPHHVEAVVEYFKDVFNVLTRAKSTRLAGLSGMRLRQERDEVMREHVSRAKFAQFFQNLKAQKISGGDASWAGEVLP